MTRTGTLALLFLLAPAPAQDVEPWQVAGLVQPSLDMEVDAAFYREALAWQVEGEGKESTVLRLGEMLLILDSTRSPGPEHPRSSIYINLRVADLEASAAKVIEHGGIAVDAEAERFVLGMCRTMRDPSGNVLNLIRLDKEPAEDAELPAIFNLGVHMHGMDALRELFVEDLGFEIYSRDYLPKTLPLRPRGALSIVLHDDAHGTWITDRSVEQACGTALLLAAGNPQAQLEPGTSSSELVECQNEHIGRMLLQTTASGIDLAFTETGNIPRAEQVQKEPKSGR